MTSNGVSGRDEVAAVTSRDGQERVLELTDSRAMRALTHPVRLALLEALMVEGPMTATEAGEMIGASPTTCSFHFRQLFQYGYVEEAAVGPGRRRPWRLSQLGLRFTDLHEDPETALAARALGRALRSRYFARLQTFYNSRESYPRRWQEVTGGSEFIVHVTPEELRMLDEEITRTLRRFQDRLSCPDLRPEGALPVEVLLFAYPARPPAS